MSTLAKSAAIAVAVLVLACLFADKCESQQDTGDIEPLNVEGMGTLDKKDWRKGDKKEIDSSEAFERMYVFKDHLDFEIVPAGWYPE